MLDGVQVSGQKSKFAPLPYSPSLLASVSLDPVGYLCLGSTSMTSMRSLLHCVPQVVQGYLTAAAIDVALCAPAFSSNLFVIRSREEQKQRQRGNRSVFCGP